LPIYPKDGKENEKLTWFFTLYPSKVIKTTSAFSLTDNTEKERVKAEMNSKKDTNNLPLSKKEYGNGKEFTDEGMVKFLYEEELSLSHKYALDQTPKRHDSGKDF
jgi:hypothetical protein